MLFNSLEFAIFLPIVFALYWLIGAKRIVLQNILILVSSYVFYGWWSLEFLGLIAFSSFVDYFAAIRIEAAEIKRKKLPYLYLSLLANLGILIYFKYTNFFIESFIEAFTLFGYHPSGYTLNIILPVGVSFYTFQTLSYTIDVYRGKMKPTKKLIAFFSYVSFFPQLVAGPIERASSLLPQFMKQRSFSFSKGRSGVRLILWGLFKKIVIADSCARLANDIFNNYQEYDSGMLILGALYFSFQIYGDFSGYSDIAIGTARLFGFNLLTNFRYPYFSRDIAEFWRRWHISLSSWFKDYVYIPLGGSKRGKIINIRNIFIIFLVSGIWHGANWTFLFWGFLNAIYFIPLYILGVNRKHVSKYYDTHPLMRIKDISLILFTFCLTMIAWIFFRSPTITDGFLYVGKIFQLDFHSVSFKYLKYLPLVGLLAGWEWIMQTKPHGLAFVKIKRPLRWAIYLGIIWGIFYFFGSEEEFIYFQF